MFLIGRSAHDFVISFLLSSWLVAGCAHFGGKKDAKLYFGHIEAPCADTDEKTGTERCADFRQLLTRVDKQCDTVDAKCTPGTEVLHRLFGDTRRKWLPDYVVYLDQKDTPGTFVRHQPILMWRDRNTRYLYGVRDVYVIVLTEHQTCMDAHLTTTYRSEPNPFTSIFSVLGKNWEPAQTKAADKPQKAQFVWYPLSGDIERPLMWLAIGAVQVDVNSTNRITLHFTRPKKKSKPQAENKLQNLSSSPTSQPEKASELPEECIVDPEEQLPGTEMPQPTVYKGDFLATNAFFSNSPDSRVAIAFGLGMTFKTRDTSVSSGGSNQNLNAYALTKFYLSPPRLHADPDKPRHDLTWGIVAGTNVTRTPFDELILGLSVGHVFGNVGFVTGFNFLAGAKDSSSTAKDASTRRKKHPFLGVDYSF